MNRLQQLKASSKAGSPLEVLETLSDSSDTAVCVRIRPLSEAEISDHHIQGIVGQSGGLANIYEPRKKINGKPDLNVSIMGMFQFWDFTSASGCTAT